MCKNIPHNCHELSPEHTHRTMTEEEEEKAKEKAKKTARGEHCTALPQQMVDGNVEIL